MTKKRFSFVLVALSAFFVYSLSSSAVKVGVNDGFGSVVDQINSTTDSVYIIGKHVFTNNHTLKTPDIMLAARSIVLSAENLKPESALPEMNIYLLRRERNDMGEPTGRWVQSKNHVGNQPLPEKFDIAYVDYKPATLEVDLDTIIAQGLKTVQSDVYSVSIDGNKINFDIIDIDKKISETTETGLVASIRDLLKLETVAKVTLTYAGEDYVLDNPGMDGQISAVYKKLQEFLAVFTEKDYLEAVQYDQVGKSLKMKVTLNEGYVTTTGEDKVNEKSYDVDFTSKYIKVTDEPTLLAALALSEEENTHIILSNDITVTSSVVVPRTVTIDGNNHKITMTGHDTWVDNGDNYVLKVYGADVVTVNLKNIHLTGAQAAMIVGNKATVNVDGLNVAGNKLGGIEVKNDETTNLVITSISNTDDQMGQPTVWVDEVEDDVLANITFALSHELTVGDQVHYYLTEDVPEEVVSVTDKDALNVALTSGAKDIYLAHGLKDLDNITVTGDDVTIYGDGITEATGTFTISGNNVTLDGVILTGDAGANAIQQPNQNGTYFIVDVTGTNFTLKNSTISNGAEESKAYAALRVTGGVATIEGNTFDTENVYNTIELPQVNELQTGTTIANNKFLGSSNHNHINFYRIADNAVINITGNYFEYSGNALRMSELSHSKRNVTFNITDNTYDATDTSSENLYAGFVIYQADTDDEDLSGYKLNVTNLIGPSGTKITESTSGEYQFSASYDARTGGKLASERQPKVTFN